MGTKTPSPVDKQIGTRARMRRLMLGMSQKELGNALGVTFQQLQKYEQGTNRISAGRLMHLSGILHVPVTFFFEDSLPAPVSSSEVWQVPDQEKTYVSKFLATSGNLALSRAFMAIKSLVLRQRIVALVEDIAGEEI